MYIWHVIALWMSIALTVVAQVLLRTGARNKRHAMHSLFNWRSLLGNTLFAGVVLMMIFAMQQVPLRSMMAATSLVYVLTPLAAWWWADDPLTRRMIGGSALIAVGVLIFFL